MKQEFLKFFSHSLTNGLEDRPTLESLARALKATQLMEWRDFILQLDPASDVQFQAIVANTLYSGFTASEFARTTDFDKQTVIRWAEGSTTPPRLETRNGVKAKAVGMLTIRIDNWSESGKLLGANRAQKPGPAVTESIEGFVDIGKNRAFMPSHVGGYETPQ